MESLENRTQFSVRTLLLAYKCEQELSKCWNG